MHKVGGNQIQPNKRSSPSAGAWAARLLLLFLAITTFVTATVMLYSRWRWAGLDSSMIIEGGDSDLSPTQRLYLQTYLSSRVEQLAAPLAPGRSPVPFVIPPGATAGDVAQSLAGEGLLTDPQLFVNYLRFYGLDSELAAGTFEIDPAQNLAELALTLTQAYPQEIQLRFLEGWRIEEMAAYLAAVTPANIDSQLFLQLAQRQRPFDLAPYEFLDDLPPEASLEGFLFPDTYTVPLDADAGYLLDLMLRNFGQRVTPEMRQQYAGQGLSLREAVTLASIVERETPLPAERPQVASVFYNRLEQEMLLQADPTVQYAVGYNPVTDNWWKSPLSQADLDLDSPYNTYLYGGLPPGPIANPGFVSLEAVARPASTSYLFFVADCTRENTHLFSETYAEHLQYVERCR